MAALIINWNDQRHDDKDIYINHVGKVKVSNNVLIAIIGSETYYFPLTSIRSFRRDDYEEIPFEK